MASMAFTSPLNSQSFVKLRTNSNYSHPSCYVPRVKNCYAHLSYKNVSHIESSKFLFIKGDSNFSFSSPKFARVVASTYSPSLNIIKAMCGQENIYHYKAYDLSKGHYIQLSDDYHSMVLLIVNIPQQGDIWAEAEIDYLNGLHEMYKDKISVFGRGFAVLGFFYDLEDHNLLKSLTNKLWKWVKREKEEEGEEITIREEDIRTRAKFPLFKKVNVNDYHKDNLWYFLRRTTNVDKIEDEFEKFVVDGSGKPIQHFIWYNGEKVVQLGELIPIQSGGYTGKLEELIRVQAIINKYFPEKLSGNTKY